MAEANDAPTIEGIDDLVEIGRGGFAIVYRGHQAAFRRDVAIKVLTRSGLDADDKRRFERECQAMGLLSDHPGIVTLYDAGFTADGRPYMVMAHVGGGSLADHLSAAGPMTWHDVARLGVRLCGALETAHRAAVLHRDIKPANILRSDYGEQLSDFGIARIAGGHETRSGVITASLAHAAPEILDGSRPTVQADIYSLGSTLYEAAMGQAAFVRDTDESLLPLIRRVVTEPVPDMSTRGVPSPLAGVVEAAMAKDPDERFASAEAFGLALRGAQAVLGVPVSELAIVGNSDGTGATTVITPAEAGPGPTAGTDDRVLGQTTGDLTSADSGAATGHDAQPDVSGPARIDTEQAPAPPAVSPPPPADVPAGHGTPASEQAAPPPPPPRTPAKRAASGGGSRGAVIFATVGIVAAVIAAIVFFATRPGDDTAGSDDTTPPTISTTSEPTNETDPSTTVEPVTTTAAPGGPIEPQGPVAVILEGQLQGQLRPIVTDSLGFLESSTGLTAAVEVVSPASLRPGLDEFVSRGYDPIIVFGRLSVPDVLDAASGNPDTTFVLIDGFAQAANVVSITFATNESSFLAGVAAARASATRRVAFIGAADDPETRAAEAGFVAGVRFIDAGVPIDVRYLESGFAGPTNRDAARQLTNLVLAGGADVVYHVAGASGAGVVDAAAVTGGVWTIGSDIDWFSVVPPEQQPFVLTSTFKYYGEALGLALQASRDGTLETAARSLGLANGGVDFSINGGYLDGILGELQSIGTSIADGTLIAPDVVVQRALAPLGADCPQEGCQVRITNIAPSGAEILVALEANWIMNVNGTHAHYFWSPTYTPEQVGSDSAARFGVAVGSWDIDDRFPFYVTENAASRALQGDATDLCVVAADPNHNVIDPALAHCVSVAGLP